MMTVAAHSGWTTCLPAVTVVMLLHWVKSSLERWHRGHGVRRVTNIQIDDLRYVAVSSADLTSIESLSSSCALAIVPCRLYELGYAAHLEPHSSVAACLLASTRT